MMNVKEYRELYEGLTQEDARFRDAIYALSEQVPEQELFSELDRAQNKLNHAMLGIHPLYRREVELSGIVDYANRSLHLYQETEEQVLSFDDLDPAYVSFLEQQKRVYNVKECMPLSSVALKTSHQWLEADGVEVPKVDAIAMSLSQDTLCYSHKTLQMAFARSMVLMNHLQEQMEQYGLLETYDVNREGLIQYVQSNSFDFQFAYSVKELSAISQEAANMDGLEQQ